MQFLRQPFPFVSGLDQFTEQRQTMGLLNLVNLAWTKTGLLQKLPGTASKGTALVTFPGLANSTLTTASKLVPHRDELVVIDGPGQTIQSWSSAESKWYQRDTTPEATISRQSIAQGENNAFGADVAKANGLLIYVWQGASGGVASNGLSILGTIYATVIDATTGAIIMANTPLSNTTMSAPRVVVGLASGVPTAMCIYADAAGSLYYRSLNLTAPQSGWVAQATLVNDTRQYTAGPPAQYAGSFDVVSIDAAGTSGAATDFVIAYESTAATPSAIRVNRYLFSISGAIPAAAASVQLNEAVTPIFAFGLQATAGERIYVCYALVTGGNGLAKVTSLNTTTLATLVAPTTLYNSGGAASSIPTACGVARLNSTTATLVFQPVDARFESVTFTSALAQVGATVEQFGLIVVSRPFTYGGRVYALVYKPSSLQGTAYLADLNAGLNVGSGFTQGARPVATALPRQALRSITGIGATALSSLGGVVAMSDTRMSSVLSASVDSNRALTMQVNFEFANTARHQPVDLGDITFLSGGVPSTFDGVQCAESGFTYYPEISASNLTPANAGGSLGQGTYQYVLVYEFIDARGNRHRSAPSIAASVTTTGVGTVNQVTITAPTYAFTNRQRPYTQYTNPVGVIVYRTVVNGTTFYRVTADSLDFDAFSQSCVNVPQVGTLTMVDKASDAAISDGSHPILYTTGGVLPNFCPPTATSACQHRNRVWLSSTDDDGVLWYSKGLSPGIAPEFNDALTFRVGGSGPITAIAPMDDKLVVFRADGIHILYGDGANDLGTGSSLDSQRLTSEVGCIEPRSVVLLPSGLMFQSRRGIELLTRGLEVQFVGSPVVDTLASYPTITSAVVLVDQYQVRFTCASGAGSVQGVSLIYDYVRGQWSTRYYYDGFTSVATAAMASAGRWNNGYVMVTPLGIVKTESTTDYRDDGEFITSTIETDWKKMASLSGYQRIRRVDILGTRLDSCGLTVSIATDFVGAYSQVKTYGPAQLDTLALEDIDLRIVRAKCQSIRVKIEDFVLGATPSTYQGSAFSGISVEYGIYRGPRPVSANARG